MQATVQDPQEFTPHSFGAETGGAHRSAQENLEAFAAAFFEGAGPALTTVLNRKVALRVVEVVPGKPADLIAATALPWVLIEATYQRGMRGTHWLVLGKTAALALAEAMTGALENEGGDILPAHQESLREAANQILAAAGTALMPLFARAAAFTPATVNVVDDAESLPADLARAVERLWVVRARAAGEGLEVDLLLTIGPELARDIGALGAEEAPTADEPRRAAAPPSKIDFIMDVALPVRVELGRARMQIQDILKLAPGSVIELDKAAGDPVELYINDRPIAKGEVVIIDENFGVRLTSIVTASERIKTLR